jgi:hypothetical protein
MTPVKINRFKNLLPSMCLLMSEVADPGEHHRQPALVAAVMTSLSRTLPPGWITAAAPFSATTSSPSRNGKDASDATTE